MDLYIDIYFGSLCYFRIISFHKLTTWDPMQLLSFILSTKELSYLNRVYAQTKQNIA